MLGQADLDTPDDVAPPIAGCQTTWSGPHCLRDAHRLLPQRVLRTVALDCLSARSWLLPPPRAQIRDTSTLLTARTLPSCLYPAYVVESDVEQKLPGRRESA